MIKKHLIISVIISLCIFCFVFISKVKADELISYSIEISGIEDDDLKESLLEYSTAQAQIESPPKSLFALKHRAKQDVPTFIKLLHSQAYFNAKITIESEPDEDEVVLIYAIELGKQYLLTELTFDINSETLEEPNSEQLDLELKQAAISAEILAAEQQLLRHAKNEAHAFAELCPRKVVVNHDLSTVQVNFCINTGKQVYLGDVTFEGHGDVDADFLYDLIHWQANILYNQTELDQKRLKLVESRLFTVAHLHLNKEPDANGMYPVTFKLTKRLPRTVSAGLRLTTDEELFLLRLTWEHRNLWSRGETIETELNISMVKSSVEAGFRKPVFYAPENTFIFDSIFTKEDTDAYDGMRAELIAAVEHQLGKKERINAGLAYQFSRITEQNSATETESFNLLSIPVHYSWDFSDNALEPTKGGRIWLDAQPFVDTTSGAVFYKQKIRYNHYLSLLESNALILAGRIIAGNIIGANAEKIPADLRYFAGGGDTIRGYSFQAVSPKNSLDELIGGRSLLALSSELRGWITDSIGAVVFMDAGRAYANTYQDFAEPLQIGAGLGARYKTPIGALRADIAIPVNKRPYDDDYQIYISIGHTF